ncbi:MAG: hypothetical protein HQL32_05520 [Planctomycetes bacterium]|nr:hypothetical protein [Planctomycetota bacterium]
MVLDRHNRIFLCCPYCFCRYRNPKIECAEYGNDKNVINSLPIPIEVELKCPICKKDQYKVDTVRQLSILGMLDRTVSDDHDVDWKVLHDQVFSYTCSKFLGVWRDNHLRRGFLELANCDSFDDYDYLAISTPVRVDIIDMYSLEAYLSQTFFVNVMFSQFTAVWHESSHRFPRQKKGVTVKDSNYSIKSIPTPPPTNDDDLPF